MDNSAIIKRIEQRIAELGMTKAEFYQKSGVSSASFSQWKTGRYKPATDSLHRVADCLSIPYEYLAYGSVDVSELHIAGSGLNEVRLLGRDGRLVVRHLSDEQLAALEAIINQLPEASDL